MAQEGNKRTVVGNSEGERTSKEEKGKTCRIKLIKEVYSCSIFS